MFLKACSAVFPANCCFWAPAKIAEASTQPAAAARRSPETNRLIMASYLSGSCEFDSTLRPEHPTLVPLGTQCLQPGRGVPCDEPNSRSLSAICKKSCASGLG